MPFRITTKNVLQFTWRRRTVDSTKEKLKGKFLKNIEHDLFTRGQMVAYMNSYRWLYRRQMESNVFLFWLCYKRNGKRCSCATMELWMHLGGLLSTQDSYASFVLSNLPRASITPWLHAARLPFLNCDGEIQYLWARPVAYTACNDHWRANVVICGQWVWYAVAFILNY